MIKQVLLAIDQLLNAIFFGYADETLSARCHRNQFKSWYWSLWREVINTIFFWQHDHCADAYESEIKRRQLPKEYR